MIRKQDLTSLQKIQDECVKQLVDPYHQLRILIVSQIIDLDQYCQEYQVEHLKIFKILLDGGTQRLLP